MWRCMVGFAALWAGSAVAAPAGVVHSGRALDASGGAISGVKPLVVSLYSAESGTPAGEPLFTESFASVGFTDGYFSVVVGGGAAPIPPSALAPEQVWLELAVDGSVLGPRQRLWSVPYALSAGSAANAGSIPVEGALVDSACTEAGRVVFDTSTGGLRVCDGSDWRELALGRIAGLPDCEGTRSGPVCWTQLLPTGTTWSATAQTCAARGQGNHMCSAFEIRSLLADGELPAFPSGADHVWIDSAEGGDNQEVGGIYASGGNDDWPDGYHTGFGLCCQTPPRDIPATCEGTLTNGVCLRGYSASAMSFGSAVAHCAAQGRRMCTMGELSAVCAAGNLPVNPVWADAGEGDNNFEWSGVYNTCGFDDWGESSNLYAACCDTIVAPADAGDCPGTATGGVCVAAVVPSRTYAQAAVACFSAGHRMCRPAEAKVACLAGAAGSATNGFFWVDGAEGNSPNQSGSGITASGCHLDSWSAGTLGSALCCR